MTNKKIYGEWNNDLTNKNEKWKAIIMEDKMTDEIPELKEIRTTLSTQIIIQAQLNDGTYAPIGAIRKLNVTQDRKVVVKEVKDNNGEIQKKLVPEDVITMLHPERTVFDKLSLPEAFGCDFNTIDDQKIPFNIQVIWAEDKVVVTYHNCWFTHLSMAIRADDYIIYETASLVCESVSAEKMV